MRLEWAALSVVLCSGLVLGVWGPGREGPKNNNKNNKRRGPGGAKKSKPENKNIYKTLALHHGLGKPKKKPKLQRSSTPHQNKKHKNKMSSEDNQKNKTQQRAALPLVLYTMKKHPDGESTKQKCNEPSPPSKQANKNKTTGYEQLGQPKTQNRKGSISPCFYHIKSITSGESKCNEPKPPKTNQHKTATKRVMSS